jgi:two-component system chemotaxis response regulator CheY
MKILVIDDSKMIKMLVKDFLKNLGHESFEAENGQDGLNALELVKPDLILLDYNMPIMDGPTFLKNYKGSMAGKIPVIMMTTESSMEKINEVIALGASEYMMKPFDQIILSEKIEQVLG